MRGVVRFTGPNGEVFSQVIEDGQMYTRIPGLAPGFMVSVTSFPVPEPRPAVNDLVTPDQAIRNAQEAIMIAHRAAKANVDRSDREMSLMWSGIAEVWAKIAEVRHTTTLFSVEGPNTQEPKCDTCQDNGCGECTVNPDDRGDWDILHHRS